MDFNLDGPVPQFGRKDGQGGGYQDIVGVSATQTLTNKTLTSPTLTSPIINSALVNCTTATLTLSPTLHDGKIVSLNAAAGVTVTLPAATGSGACYRLINSTLVTSNSHIFKVANANDFMRGFAYVKTDDSATSANTYATANTGTVSTESDTVTWNRGTTGTAIVGDFIEFIDIAANVWAVETENNASGTEATPFSAGV